MIGGLGQMGGPSYIMGGPGNLNESITQIYIWKFSKSKKCHFLITSNKLNNSHARILILKKINDYHALCSLGDFWATCFWGRPWDNIRFGSDVSSSVPCLVHARRQDLLGGGQTEACSAENRYLQLGSGGAVSPPVGSRGEAPGSFRYFMNLTL
jgi:hypothetical protein